MFFVLDGLFDGFGFLNWGGVVGGRMVQCFAYSSFSMRCDAMQRLSELRKNSGGQADRQAGKVVDEEDLIYDFERLRIRHDDVWRRCPVGFFLFSKSSFLKARWLSSGLYIRSVDIDEVIRCVTVE